MKGEARGFTLVELLVVLAIIATLLALAAPRYFQPVERAREAVLRENLATMREAIDQYHGDTEQRPESIAALVDKRYLRAVPVGTPSPRATGPGWRWRRPRAPVSRTCAVERRAPAWTASPMRNGEG